MNDVVPGVRTVALGYVNAFVIEGAELTLVDAGPGKRGARIRRVLDDAGGTSRLRHILVTHHHLDHVGPLASLGGEGITVYAHAADARVVRGEAPPMPAPRNVVESAGVWTLDHVVSRPPPGRVDREIVDGQELAIGDGMIAYHTPGHTAGHMSFLMPSKRLLFVGDAAANYLGRLGPPVGVYNEDHDEVRRSIAKIAALDFDVACFGHGRVLKGDAMVRFRRLADKVAR